MSSFDSDLEGRRFIIVGTSSRIGSATARALLERGARVLATYHRNEVVTAPLKDEFGARVITQAFDVRDYGAAPGLTNQVIAAWGGLDGLVYAAGKTVRRPAVYQGEVDVRDVLSLNFEGFHHLARACLKPMIRSKFGRIVAIGSRAGRVGMPNESVYAASKAALSAWAASLAGEVGKFGITVNVVSAGAIDVGSEIYTASLEEEVRARTGAGRLGHPEEVAAIVCFLCGDRAGYINGTTIDVDGGARY